MTLKRLLQNYGGMYFQVDARSFYTIFSSRANASREVPVMCQAGKRYRALEASNSIHCPFTVRVLCEGDELLSSIPPRDLEPPRRRPQTSARTAQRLIAQSMGIKLPSTGFGSREYRRQEEARKNRIVSRQNLKNDAWGDDDN